jgi:hypothetical protein
MLTSLLTRWFSRQPRREAPRGRQPVVTPAVLAARARRAAAVVPAVLVAVSQSADGMVIRVKGEARPHCVGALMNGLLAPAACRPALVTLDLSELRSISWLAMGALVAYRRGVVRNGGRVRLAEELQPAVKEALARAELFELFETSADAGPAPNRQKCLASAR